MLAYQFDPIIYLNRCLVVLQVDGADKALEEIKELAENKHAQKYYLYHAALGEIHEQLGQYDQARQALSESHQLDQIRE